MRYGSARCRGVPSISETGAPQQAQRSSRTRNRARSCERRASTWPIRVRVQKAADRSAARTRGATTERASTRASERARESSAGAARMSERGKEKEERARERARGKKRQRRQPRAAGAGSSKGERAQRNIRGMVHVLFFLIARALISLFSLSFLSRSRVSRSLSSNRHLCSLTYPPSAQ